jgi:hypothetical protein
MAEYLSIKLEQEINDGLIQGLIFTRGLREINYSQIADDTLLLGASSTIIARRFKKFLYYFLNSLPTKVNNSKSIIYGWNVSNE